MRKALSLLLLVLIVPSSGMAQGSVDVNDIDGDGLLNSEEDVNGNGLHDVGETDPFNADTDGGGEADGSEVQMGRDPLLIYDDITYDRDGDGLTNGQEILLNTNAEDPDSDGDGVLDGEDLFPTDPKYKEDTDEDGLPDAYERKNNLQPDKRSDANEDPDNDQLSNVDEFIEGTDMNKFDTDEDGIGDGEEVHNETDPLENPCLYHAGPHEILHDIDGHWSAPYVRALKETKIGEDGPRIIRGYWTDEGAMFRPDHEISRFELLKIVLLGSCIVPSEEVDSGAFSFTDFRRAPRPRETEDAALKRRIIYTAYDRDIIDGYPDGTFQPDAPINRAEALKIIFTASKLEPFDTENRNGKFPDVNPGDWFADYVSMALSYEFIEGYADGTFKPEQHITRAEAAKIVLFMIISNPHVNGYVIPVEGIEL